MAKQLNFLASGQIIPTALHQEMERSYLEYAMSVIVGRALPDARDGLKPVHRRILYAMHELGLTPDRPFRKCARVVGDVLGKYHPHGDQSVYEALVRMVQDFSSRYPLLSGHGNFGSIDNDPPAAMRYTETRLAEIGDSSLLAGINETIVNFTGNFDNSQQEPVVLPARLPILILNGCSGIAVGMATNIPPHNLGEVIDGLIALIDRPDLDDEKLLEIIPGPDFPTGGEILDTAGIREAYRTGRGLIPTRGVARLETIRIEGKRRKERTAIVITELPYQVNKAAWIEKTAELVNSGRIEGIADIRDESDRDGIRVVIELKRESDPRVILNALYQQTSLQTNFGAILLALVDNQPRQLSLRELLQEFLRFREETLTRQYTDELEQANDRLHLVEGLLLALENIDRVIDILRNSADGTTAKYRFQEELGISETRADAILAMPLRRLTGLEREKLQNEAAELRQKIQHLRTLLENRPEFLKALKKELRGLKKKFGDERRTKIRIQESGVRSQEKEKTRGKSAEMESRKDAVAPPPTNREPENKKSQKPEIGAKPEPELKKNEPKVKKAIDREEFPTLTLFTPQEPPENALLVLDSDDRIGWTTPDDRSLEKDYILYREAIAKRENFVVILDTGKAYPISVRDLPPRQTQPIFLSSLLTKTAQKESDRVVCQFFPPEGQKSQDLLFLSQQGRMKRLPLSEIDELGNRGLSLIKLKEDDRLSFAVFTREGQDLAIATSGGRVLRYPVRDEMIPLSGRTTQGNPVVKLRYGESIVGCVPSDRADRLLLLSRAGYGKRVALENFRLSQLGDLGSPALQFTTKTDSLAAMVAARPNTSVLLTTDRGRKIPLAVETVTLGGKDGTGDRIAPLQTDEQIRSIAVITR
jgi:DNA gyrase subunit A